jgi:hypothetical protein
MSVKAPYSKYKKNNLKIGIAVCIFLSIVFAYDGYLSQHQWSGRRGFYEDHVKDGQADDTMKFNQKSPFVLLIAAVAFALRWQMVKDKALSADEDQLVISEKENISYDSIQQIDKTNFESKGFFVITYRNQLGAEVDRKISDRDYDELAAVLEHLVTKIS